MRLSHLGPALAAIGMMSAALIGGVVYARQVENRYVHALAPLLVDIKNQGNVLDLEAFRQPDLVPFYGGSELDSYSGRFLATELFGGYPSGFTVFPIGRKGSTPLTMLQHLAAIGPELQGKKLVISVSPSWFYAPNALAPENYSGNFSRLHASELTFSTALPFELKQAVARRMLTYPDSLEKDALLEFGLQELANPSRLGKVAYYTSLPLGMLQNVVLRLQDHWETLSFIRARPGLSPEVDRQEARLDWASLQSQAEQDARQRSTSNPFGVDDQEWQAHKMTALKRGYTDAEFITAVQQSGVWLDLDLLLRMLNRLGVRALVISPPLHGPFLDFVGVSLQARRTYYKTLKDLTESYDLPLVDFALHDADKFFLMDPWSHPSAKGWVYYAQAVDAYYHQRAFR